MKNMNLEQIAQAVGGTLIAKETVTKAEAMGVVIDNRLIEKDFIFVPIQGAKVDGHDFIPDAFAKGALGVLSEKRLDDPAGPYILVESSVQALKDLAAYYRDQIDATVVGIIGSVGKTSTKEMVASVLSQRFSVLKTQGNFNNEIGLPLTLFRVKPEHEVAVVEMGISDFGEMDRLGRMARPDMVVMTNIGQCHLENLGDRDGILRAKTEVFAHMDKKAIVFLNGDDDKLIEADTRGMERHFFGCQGQEYAASAIKSEMRGVEATLLGPKWTRTVFIPIPGAHNVYNALAAMAVGEKLGMERDEIIAGIESAVTIGGRNNMIEANGITVIDDCYNANPVSMKASLEVLSHAAGRKIAILGDMGELGVEEKQLHYEVGQFAAKNHLDVLCTVGNLSREIARGAMEATSSVDIRVYETKHALLDELTSLIKKGDTVLVKASHFMGFDEIVQALTKE